MAPILISAIHTFYWVLVIMLFARILLSWFPMIGGQFIDLLFFLTDPILSPIRALIQKSPLGGPGMVMDFSPLIAFLLLGLVRNLAISLVGMFA